MRVSCPFDGIRAETSKDAPAKATGEFFEMDD
jgi:hypothetical protein